MNRVSVERMHFELKNNQCYLIQNDENCVSFEFCSGIIDEILKILKHYKTF